MNKSMPLFDGQTFDNNKATLDARSSGQLPLLRNVLEFRA
jgi:hypothetical protein